MLEFSSTVLPAQSLYCIIHATTVQSI